MATFDPDFTSLLAPLIIPDPYIGDKTTNVIRAGNYQTENGVGVTEHKYLYLPWPHLYHTGLYTPQIESD